MGGDITRLLRLGEDSVCEFKSMRIPGKRVVSPDSKEIADDIAAAANAAGATFLLGVDDKTHEVEGIPEYRLLGNSELMLTIYSVPIEDRARLQEIATVKQSADETINADETISGTLNGTLKGVDGTLNPESGTLSGILNDTARKVLDYISGHGGCQASSIIEDLEMPRDTLNKVIKRLVDSKLVERRGSKKTGGYYLREGVQIGPVCVIGKTMV